MPGEFAAFASHAVLWEACAASGRPMAILEDNATLSDDFPRALALAEAEIARGADYIRLAGTYDYRHVPVRHLSSDMRLVQYLKGPGSTTAYVLSPQGARAFLAGVRKWAEPVDDYLDRFWVHGVPTLALHPFPVRRSDVPTDIVGSRQPTGLLQFAKRLVLSWDGTRRQIYLRRHGLIIS